jgi:chromosome segregation ATPase
MEDLNFRDLDEQIALARERVTQLARERARWESDRRSYEERLRALEGEVARLREDGKRMFVLESENEKFRKSHEAARLQVSRMLERIRTLEG